MIGLAGVRVEFIHPRTRRHILFKTTYPNINISVLVYFFSCRRENSQYLTDFLKYLPKKMALLVQNCGEKKRCHKPFPAFFKTKKTFGFPNVSKK